MIVRIFNENYNKMMSKGRLKVLIEFFRIHFYLGFSSCININCYVARYIFININKQYTETRIGAIIFVFGCCSGHG